MYDEFLNKDRLSFSTSFSHTHVQFLAAFQREKNLKNKKEKKGEEEKKRRKGERRKTKSHQVNSKNEKVNVKPQESRKETAFKIWLKLERGSLCIITTFPFSQISFCANHLFIFQCKFSERFNFNFERHLFTQKKSKHWTISCSFKRV